MNKFKWGQLGEDLLCGIGDIFIMLFAVLAFAWLLSLFGIIAIIMWFLDGHYLLAWLVTTIDIVMLIYIIYTKYSIKN